MTLPLIGLVSLGFYLSPAMDLDGDLAGIVLGAVMVVVAIGMATGWHTRQAAWLLLATGPSGCSRSAPELRRAWPSTVSPAAWRDVRLGCDNTLRRSATIRRREPAVKSWDIKALEVKPRQPEILSSTSDARAIVIHLTGGDSLKDHEVHERALLVVIDGEIEVTTTADERVTGGPGLLVEFAPRERHEVTALSDARVVLLLTPWPGSGHPGVMTIEEKADVRRRAAERARP